MKKETCVVVLMCVYVLSNIVESKLVSHLDDVWCTLRGYHLKFETIFSSVVHGSLQAMYIYGDKEHV